jgi:hypothetical protein
MSTTENDRGDWLMALAVVQGKSHIDRNTPCQDYCAVRTTADGHWLAAVVCDGAGSAARAGEGAQIVAESFSQNLILEIPQIERHGWGWLGNRVHGIVGHVRDVVGSAGRIEDFNCTLVAVLLGPAGGCFYHIGDGAALASKVSWEDEGAEWCSPRVKLWNEIILSEPENGEYANETFFVTGKDWRGHLRRCKLPDDLDIVALMSDGAMPFVLQKARPYSPFMDPTICALLRAPGRRERDALLNDYLASQQTYRISSDDKTLFIALRPRLKAIIDWQIVSTGIGASTDSQHDEPGEQSRPTTRSIPNGATAIAEIQVHEPTPRARQPRAPVLLAAAALMVALLSLATTALIYVQLGNKLKTQTEVLGWLVAKQNESSPEQLNQPELDTIEWILWGAQIASLFGFEDLLAIGSKQAVNETMSGEASGVVGTGPNRRLPNSSKGGHR